MQFIACELEPLCACEREAIVKELLEEHKPPLLVLNTCQRLETFGLCAPESNRVRIIERRKDGAAFERLARIAAGLESRILGELEILGQVRGAVQHLQTAGGLDDSATQRMFQDVLELARKARRVSGIDRNVTSLSALGSKEILSRVAPGEPLAVVGSGSLASSVARYLNHRGKSPIRVAARCPKNAMCIAERVNGFAAGLDNLAHLFKDVAGIVSATAAPHPVIYPHHLDRTQRPLVIVDLAVPPDCSPDVKTLPGVTYIDLGVVETQAQANLEERKSCSEVAAQIIRECSQAWAAALKRKRKKPEQNL